MFPEVETPITVIFVFVSLLIPFSILPVSQHRVRSWQSFLIEGKNE
jgi:hypothetical protein